MSKALALIAQMGWTHRPSGIDQVAVMRCPLCFNENWKFYMCIEGEKDGLFDCKVCTESGNYWQLQERLGIKVSSNIVSLQDASSRVHQVAAIPDINTPHWRLTKDEAFADALDYLVCDRGISMAVIEEHKIGVEVNPNTGNWITYPYLDGDGKCIFVKYRSMPPAPKDFRGLTGRENPLFNGRVLRPKMDRLFVCEGEIDTLTLLSQGISDAVGVPGAAMKKVSWIDKLDQVAPKVIYLVYDTDKAGQQNARDMAARIGVEKVRNVVLPEFTTEDGKPGKDVNEWFKAGHTLAEFEELVAKARPFDIDGVQSIIEVLEELYNEFTERGVEPTLKTPWESLTKRVGGYEWGDLVGVLADAKIGKTTTVLNWVDYYAQQGYPSFLFCEEMKPTRMVRKWVSFITQTDDTPGRSKMSPEAVKQSMEIGSKYAADLLFGYTRFSKADEIFETIRQTVRRYGTKVVAFDNLHLLCRSMDNMSQEVSNLTKTFKAIAMELNILMILLMQPKRIGEGKIISAHDGYGSSAIPKDVDSMICLHRNRVAVVKESEFHGIMETEDNFDPFMLVRADLTRYAPGGCCTLYMDGATSTVREVSSEELNNRPKVEVPNGDIPIAA